MSAFFATPTECPAIDPLFASRMYRFGSPMQVGDEEHSKSVRLFSQAAFSSCSLTEMASAIDFNTSEWAPRNSIFLKN